MVGRGPHRPLRRRPARPRLPQRLARRRGAGGPGRAAGDGGLHRHVRRLGRRGAIGDDVPGRRRREQRAPRLRHRAGRAAAGVGRPVAGARPAPEGQGADGARARSRGGHPPGRSRLLADLARPKQERQAPPRAPAVLRDHGAGERRRRAGGDRLRPAPRRPGRRPPAGGGRPRRRVREGAQGARRPQPRGADHAPGRRRRDRLPLTAGRRQGPAGPGRQPGRDHRRPRARAARRPGAARPRRPGRARPQPLARSHPRDSGRPRRRRAVTSLRLARWGCDPACARSR
jgi:hypothetical protein